MFKTMNKNRYIAPSTEVTKLLLQNHLLLNSVNSVEGLDGVTVSKNDFGGGDADVKSGSSYNVWEDDWSK